VTLKFLGGVDTDRLAAVVDALGVAVTPCRPFDLGVRDLGAFPTATRARVLWAGIDAGAEAAAALAARIDDALASLGFDREPRPFAAHVTLGRVRQPRASRRLAEALTGGPYGRQHVDHLSLMRSELSPHGARYTELAALPLRGGEAE
jgi:2'-5' RNA ligase